MQSCWCLDPPTPSPFAMQSHFFLSQGYKAMQCQGRRHVVAETVESSPLSPTSGRWDGCHQRWPPTVQASTQAPREKPNRRQCLTTISSGNSSPLSCLATTRCCHLTSCVPWLFLPESSLVSMGWFPCHCKHTLEEAITFRTSLVIRPNRKRFDLGS